MASLSAAADTSLFNVPQLFAVVLPLRTIVTSAPLARVAQEQERTCGDVPLIEQPETSGVSAQVTPWGSMSVRLTFFASPRPLFFNSIVKEAVSPALIGPLPDLVTTRSGQLTSMVVTGSEVTPDPLVAVAVA